MNDLEVNHTKDMLKTLKAIFTNPKISHEHCDALLTEWIGLLEEIDSVFLNQLVFFSISSNPLIWGEDGVGALKKLKKYFSKIICSVNTLEMALDSWILLLKAESKHQGENECFDILVESFTEQVEGAFQKHRGASIDPIWERVFGIAQMICNASEQEMTRVKDLTINSLEQLNDFK